LEPRKKRTEMQGPHGKNNDLKKREHIFLINELRLLKKHLSTQNSGRSRRREFEVGAQIVVPAASGRLLRRRRELWGRSTDYYAFLKAGGGLYVLVGPIHRGLLRGRNQEKT